MTTWYVRTDGNDANAGTTDSAAGAFLTISKGCTSAAAGDTIIVGNGSYQGAILVTTTSANGTSVNPITLKAQNKYGAKIAALASMGSNAHASPGSVGIEIFRDWWIIDGFEVDGTNGYTGNTWTIGGTEWYIGIYLTGSNCVCQNCKVHDLRRSQDNISNGGGGIVTEYFYGGSTSTIKYNIVYSIGSGSSNTTVHGIYNQQTTTKIQGNLCYKNAADNISCWHATDVMEICNNTSFQAINGAGILIGSGGGGAIGGAPTNCRVFNNILYDNKNGLEEASALGARGNLIDTNLINGNTTNIITNGLTPTNTINAAPAFVNYQADGSGDYNLQSGSPAQDVGIASLGTSPTANAPTSDITGTSRPQNSVYDLGAYEFVTASPLASPNKYAFGGKERRNLR